MNELTLEALAKRVELLEILMHVRPDEKPPAKDWRAAVGKLGNDETIANIFAEGRAIREAERKAVREENTP